MGSVPGYAAVSQTVEQAGIVGGPKGAGLGNAVLRALSEGGDDPAQFPDFNDDPVGHLSSWGSHPRWLVKRWVQRFGSAEARTIVEAGNRVPDLFLRPVGAGVEQTVETLRAKGLEVSVDPGLCQTVRLPPHIDPSAVLSEVPGIIQDPAAAETADFVGITENERVADLCAAPGGKGIALIDSGGWLVGLDRSLGRLKRMQASLRRLGLPERLVVARGETPPFRTVDTVLVDAPCTGTGTLARHPDARWRLTPESPAHMAGVQSQILEGAARIVRPGGRLIYSTCTLEVEENEEVVRSFLGIHEDFALDEREAFLSILPGGRSADGAFAVCLRRNE
jgi:16S rRNA (cytosine967-C5)-methyltransferase